MPIDSQQARRAYLAAQCLYTADDLSQAMDRMAADITRQLSDSNPLVLAVMVGGLIPAGHLLPRLDFPLQVDYLHATRYRGNTQGGKLHWMAHPRMSMKDRVVLLIDDILDEGHTLAAICEHCCDEGASKVYSAVMLEKMHGRAKGMKADFVGLEVEDKYVFGYGMDYKEYLRNAPGIYAVNENG